MSKGIVQTIAGGAMIAAGVLIEVGTLGGGTALAAQLIVAGAGMVISGVGTMMSKGPIQGFATATRNPVAPWNVVYGRARVGGTLVYLNSFGEDDKWLDLVFVLAAHPCEAVDALLFDQHLVQIDTTHTYTGDGAGSPAPVNTSFTPAQQNIQIRDIRRVSGIVTVCLLSDIPLLQDGDHVLITNEDGGGILDTYKLTGRFPVTIVGRGITSSNIGGATAAIIFTYPSGGVNCIVDNEGTVRTTWADYGRKVYMETMLGTQTLGQTFYGMQYGTPEDGDGGNLALTPSGGTPNPWKSTCSLVGMTAVMLRLHYNDAIFANGLPQISFLVRGKKDILDPRTSPPSTGYTENAALCIADYLSNQTYGFKAAYGTEIPTPQLIAAANICDEAVTLASTETEPRYALNGSFPLSMRRGEVLKNLLTACGGRLTYSGGQFVIWPAAWNGVSASITGGSIYSLSTSAFRWKPTVTVSELYNGVKGTFISPANKWQSSDFPRYAQDAIHGYTWGVGPTNDINLDNDGERRWLDIQLPFTISPATAQRLAKIELMRRRQQGTGTFALNMSGYQFTPMDVVEMDLAFFGWTAKSVEVLASRLTLNKQGDGVTLLGTEIDVQETDASVYSWATGEELSVDGFQQLITPDTRTPAPPTDFFLSSANNEINATWTAPADGFVLNGGHVEIRYQKVESPEGLWLSLAKMDPSVTAATISALATGDQYIVEIRSVNAAGIPSVWVIGTPDTSSPPSPGPITVIGGSGTVASPDNVTIDSVNVEATTINGNRYVSIQYTPPSPIGVFMGVYVEIEAPDQSAADGTPLSGGVALDGTTSLGGPRHPYSFGPLAYSDTGGSLAVTFPDPPAAQLPMLCLVRLISFSALVTNDVSGSPTQTFTIQGTTPAKPGAATAYCENVIAFTADTPVLSNQQGRSITTITCHQTRPNDPTWQGSVFMLLNVEGGLVTQSSVISAPTFDLIFATPSWRPQTCTLYAPGSDGTHINPVVAGITPQTLVTVGVATPTARAIVSASADPVIQIVDPNGAQDWAIPNVYWTDGGLGSQDTRNRLGFGFTVRTRPDADPNAWQSWLVFHATDASGNPAPPEQGGNRVMVSMAGYTGETHQTANISSYGYQIAGSIYTYAQLEIYAGNQAASGWNDPINSTLQESWGGLTYARLNFGDAPDGVIPATRMLDSTLGDGVKKDPITKKLMLSVSSEFSFDGSGVAHLDHLDATKLTQLSAQFANVGGVQTIDTLDAALLRSGLLQIGGGTNKVSLAKFFDTAGTPVLMGFIGDDSAGTGYVGSWFKRCGVGGPDPLHPQFYADASGNVFAVSISIVTTSGSVVTSITPVSGGVVVADGTDSTLYDQSGMVATLAGGVTALQANLQLLGKVTSFNGSSTAGSTMGVAPIYGAHFHTSQSSNISDTDIWTSTPPAGIYRVTVYLFTTTASGTDTVAVHLKYNDGALSRDIIAANITLATTGSSGIPAGYAQATVIVHSNGSAIQYSTLRSGPTGSPQYSLDVMMERLA